MCRRTPTPELYTQLACNKPLGLSAVIAKAEAKTVGDRGPSEAFSTLRLLILRAAPERGRLARCEQQRESVSKATNGGSAREVAHRRSSLRPARRRTLMLLLLLLLVLLLLL